MPRRIDSVAAERAGHGVGHCTKCRGDDVAIDRSGMSAERVVGFVEAESMSQRSDQVASSIRRHLQELLARGLNDPRIRGLVSVVKVTVTEDLSEATASISVLPDLHAPLTLKGLRSAAGHLQGRMARAASLRRVPKLRFVLDDSMRTQAEMDATLRGIRDAAASAEAEAIDDERGEPNHPEESRP